MYDNYLPMNVKFIRTSQGLTQAEIARELGISQGTVARAEANPPQYSFTVSQALKLSEIFKIDLESLVKTNLSETHVNSRFPPPLPETIQIFVGLS